MQTDELILTEAFCNYYKIDYSFIADLQRVGLIEITSVERATYIPESELQKLEQLVRLHYDLDINLEGIDAIAHLLEKVKHLQNEVIGLKNRLKLYEDF
ncbi:chaperone modulator CbpM [Segetibacter sp.]|jgi:chaperone modulatory protein CbpM|uniref:chaperone modulator CbpM n=1 Tax=Segetibacter sp. TaxID=2231182 RepID=UPI00262CD848|nr:chaperone modulator CbpM [Segetibacter sp.]MCW3079526.1 MerR family transcriptional regulator [Segetibacter sp.]